MGSFVGKILKKVGWSLSETTGTYQCSAVFSWMYFEPMAMNIIILMEPPPSYTHVGGLNYLKSRGKCFGWRMATELGMCIFKYSRNTWVAWVVNCKLI